MKLVPYYYGDGEVVMLPEDQVLKMRKCAAAVLDAAARAWVRQDRDSMVLLGQAVGAAAQVGCYNKPQNYDVD